MKFAFFDERKIARWNWTTSVWYLLILEFKSMKLNFILLPQLLCAICKVSGSLHLGKTMA